MSESSDDKSDSENAPKIVFYLLEREEFITEEEAEEYIEKTPTLAEARAIVDQIEGEISEKQEEVIAVIRWLMDDFNNGGSAVIRGTHLLAKYEEQVLEIQDEINLVLEENLHRAERDIPHRTLQQSVSNTLSIQFRSEELSEILAGTILRLISDFDENVPQSLKQTDTSLDLKRFISRLNTKFEAEVRWSKDYQNSGNNFVKYHETESVIRNRTHKVGINHFFDLNLDGGITINTNLESTLDLIDVSLREEIRALNEFEERAMFSIDEETIDTVVEKATKLQETYNNAGQESNPE